MKLPNLIAIVFVALTLISCGGSSDPKFRIAHTFESAEEIEILSATSVEFAKQYPKVATLEYSQFDEDAYHNYTLATITSGNNVPGAFFLWAGNEVAIKARGGELLALDDELAKRKWNDRFTEKSLMAGNVDGHYYMVPNAIDVSVLLWVNTGKLAANGIEMPGTWTEFEAACAKLKDEGEIPLLQGNSGHWPMGNFAALVLSRWIGEEKYEKLFTGAADVKFTDADVVEAMAKIEKFRTSGWINSDNASIDDDTAFSEFLGGKGAFLPIGSWKTSAFLDAKYKHFVCVNLPKIEGGKGDQNSVMAQVTGYVIPKNSEFTKEALDYLEIYTSPSFSNKWENIGCLTPLKRELLAPPAVDVAEPGERNAATFISEYRRMLEAGAIVRPPDTTYSKALADSFNKAVAQILSGAGGLSASDAMREVRN
ncbi:MAG: ABC transporter substrate-binding protein [Planctomycetes bacterium]|nr:ABC transporter substrate-binding protein [Planctomycetota bacterium]